MDSEDRKMMHKGREPEVNGNVKRNKDEGERQDGKPDITP